MKKFCPNCGKEIKKDVDFCPNCGHKLKKSSNASSNNISSSYATSQHVKETRAQVQKKKKKPISKKKKIIFSFIGILVIFFGGFYIWGSNYYAESNQLRRIVLAIKNPDKTAGKYISSTDPDIKITDQSVKPLQSYYNEHKTAANNLILQFEHQTDMYGVNFVQSGRYFLIFPKYTLRVPSFTPTVRTNHSNSVVRMNNESIGKLHRSGNDYVKKLQPILPGKYNFSINSTVQGRKLSTISQNDIWSDSSINLNIKTATLEIHSLPNSVVYINNKKIGTLDNKGRLQLKEYPITESMNLFVRNEVNGKTIQSEKIKDLSQELDYAGNNTDIVSYKDGQYVIEPEWKGLVSKDEAESILDSAFDSPDEDQFVDGAGNDSYQEMKKMIDSYKDQDDITNIESKVNVPSIVPYSNNLSKIRYTVTWTFEHDDYKRFQVMRYTDALLTQDDSATKIKYIGTGKLVKDRKISTTDSESSDDD